MKTKIVFLCGVLFFAFMSCKSTPRAANLLDSDFQSQYDLHGKSLDLTGAQKYTVKKGDRLTKIARELYGSEDNAYYFPIIMSASSGVVKNPDLISPGMVLTVPDLKRNLDNKETRGNIKNLLNGVADLYKKAGKYQATQAGLRNRAQAL